MLLEMATPDAIARLPASGLEAEARSIWNTYFHEQQHSSLAALMSHVLKSDNVHLAKRRQEGLLVQVSRAIFFFNAVILCCLSGLCMTSLCFNVSSLFRLPLIPGCCQRTM